MVNYFNARLDRFSGCMSSRRGQRTRAGAERLAIVCAIVDISVALFKLEGRQRRPLKASGDLGEGLRSNVRCRIGVELTSGAPGVRVRRRACSRVDSLHGQLYHPDS
jgi:hypothetical protein